MSTHNLMRPLVMDDISSPRMAAFTPGPWFASENEREPEWLICRPDHSVIVMRKRPPEFARQDEADAHLIAGATELLARLVEVWAHSDAYNERNGITRTPELQRMYLKAQAAIAAVMPSAKGNETPDGSEA